MNNYKSVLFFVSFLAFLSSPAFPQSDSGGVGTGGGSNTPHSGIGDCGAGKVAQRLNQNAPPTCVSAGGIGASPGGNNTDVQYNNNGAFGGTDSFTTDGSGNTVISGKTTIHNVNALTGNPDLRIQLDPNNDAAIQLDTAANGSTSWFIQSTLDGGGHFGEIEFVSSHWEPFFCWDSSAAGAFYNGTCAFQQPSTQEPLHLIRSTDSGPGGDMIDVETNTAGAELWSVDALGHEKFWGSSSGIITLQQQAASGTYNWNWPTTAGTSGYCLASAGGGSSAMTWVQCVTGATSVTSVTGTANQILASPTTGAVILSLIGPYTPSSFTAHVPLLGEGTSSIGVAEGVGSNGQIFTGQSAADPAWETMSGDGTFSNTGVLTVTKINGTTPGGSCSAGFVVTSIDSHGVPTCTQKTDKFATGLVVVGTNNQILADIAMTTAETVPVNCTGSTATSVVAATGNTTFTIKKITSGGSSTTIGTVLFSASGKTGAFTCASPVSLASTDLLEIDGPPTADGTLTQMGITISANAGGL